MSEENEANSKSPETRTERSTIGIWFSLLAVILIICTFGYGYFQLAKVNMTLANMTTNLQARTENAQRELTATQKNIADLQQNLQKVADLQTAQQQAFTEWQRAQTGDRDKSQVLEAQYLVKLANDYLLYAQDTPLTYTLLQRADAVLQSLQDARVLEIRKSIATNLAALDALPKIDVSTLYLRVIGLDNQVDQLPLPVTPLTASAQAPLNTNHLPWWQAALQHTWQALQKMVIVRNTSQEKMLPLVLPDEKLFLYQNLHAQMEALLWAIRTHNPDVYQASLTRLLQWVQLYFQANAPTTIAFVQALQELQKVDLKRQTVDLAPTIQLFNNYLSAPQSSV